MTIQTNPIHDKILRTLKQRLEKAEQVSTPEHEPPAMPVASPAEVASAEEALGFELPPLLKRIYTELGNGGSCLGPAYGLFGLPGGYGGETDNIVTVAKGMGDELNLDWWDKHILVTEIGCSMFYGIDCSDTLFSVYEWDGNTFDDAVDCEDPSPALWSLVADTMEDWILEKNYNLETRQRKHHRKNGSKR